MSVDATGVGGRLGRRHDLAGRGWIGSCRYPRMVTGAPVAAANGACLSRLQEVKDAE